MGFRQEQWDIMLHPAGGQRSAWSKQIAISRLCGKVMAVSRTKL